MTSVNTHGQHNVPDEVPQGAILRNSAATATKLLAVGHIGSRRSYGV